VIPRDTEVVLDVDAKGLRSLTVDGKLTFSNERDLELETEWIYLRGGELEIGTEARPHTRKATITLTDKVPGEDINTMGDRGIMLMRGTLNLHGDREHTWSKLAKTAEKGATRIEVLDARGWRGDRARVDRLRAPAGRAAHDRRDRGQHADARPAARVHALRRDHLRGRRARRGRAADAQHPHPGVRGRRHDLFRRAHHGDGR